MRYIFLLRKNDGDIRFLNDLCYEGNIKLDFFE